MVPFNDIWMVCSPRFVLDGPRLDVSGGKHQIGMTLSKFWIAANSTKVENFRQESFELQIWCIGFYMNPDASDGAAAAEPKAAGDVDVAGGGAPGQRQHQRCSRHDVWGRIPKEEATIAEDAHALGQAVLL